MRTLRQKSLRAALYYAAGGKCQLCGVDLPSDWHADHVVPWCVSGRTNVHEMQALCPQCNQQKGAHMLRTHQSQFQKICKDIHGGTVRRIICHVTPGGGKSLLPVIAAKQLIPTVIDKICWITPNLSLQEQAAGAFLDSAMRKMLGHSYEIREATNECNPSRGKVGYATTYQAIAMNPSINAQEVARYRYAVVLDEPHHAALDSTWHHALREVIRVARLVILMSGTLERADGRAIAFVPYDNHMPVLTDSGDTAVIRYGRSLALKEQAIIRLQCTRIDGRAEWMSTGGLQEEVGSLAQAGESTRDAIYTALRTEYATELLDRCVAHWQDYRRHFNPRSKLLVVAADISQAKYFLKYLKSRGITADIATSDEPEQAQIAIRRYKQQGQSALNVLVSVKMAYEGLDVPSITHIACLTHIRSRPWIEQMLARATRYDRKAGPWEDQLAHVFAPDDVLLTGIIDGIIAEQQAAIREPREYESDEREGRSAREPEKIAPLASVATLERSIDMTDGTCIPYDEHRRLQDAKRAAGLPLSIPEIGLREFLNAYNGQAASASSVATAVPDLPTITPRQREQRLRQQISRYTGKYERLRKMEFGTINKKAIQVFDKPRSEMTESELVELFAWVRRNYPLS